MILVSLRSIVQLRALAKRYQMLFITLLGRRLLMSSIRQLCNNFGHRLVRQDNLLVFHCQMIASVFPSPLLLTRKQHSTQHLRVSVSLGQVVVYVYCLPTAILCPVIDVFLAIATYISAHSLRSVTSFNAALSLSAIIVSAGNFWPYQQKSAPQSISVLGDWIKLTHSVKSKPGNTAFILHFFPCVFAKHLIKCNCAALVTE
jgi:hypothetical protein